MENKFSRISVNADDADEVVIQAGAVRARRVEESRDDQDFSQEARSKVGESSQETVDSAPEVTAVAAADDYHETTLDDLKSTPMSSMQKVIIAVALVAVIAAAVYIACFM